jgi:succinate dehydrogenase/fumarate reductase flavoprotein subunit
MMAQNDYDVVVLGSGIAGLSAALAAAEAGLRPLVIEKSELLGGGTTQSYGLIWVGQNHLQRAAGLADSRDDIVRYLGFLGGGELDEERMLAFVDRSPAILEFFDRCGIRFRLVHGITDHYFGRAPGALAEGRTFEAELISGFELGEWRERIFVPDDVPCYVTIEEQAAWGGLNRFSQWDRGIVAERQRRDMRGKGLGLVCHFVKALADRGVPIRTGQKVSQLVFDGTRVTGVRMSDGGMVVARRGVVIATGGYDYNLTLAKSLEGFPSMVPMSPTSLTGDGLVLGGELGGVIRRVENCLSVMLGYTVPAAGGGVPTSCRAGIVELLSPHTMLVNRLGRRFADESFFQGIVPHLRTFDALRHEHPNVPCYLIFDQQYPDHYSFANRAAGSAVPDAVARGETVAALATKLGIDPAALTDTVERFNAYARAGADADFHRGESKWCLASGEMRPGKNPSLGAVEKPPFYGVELHPSVGNSAGLLANRHGQVMHQRHRPIAGLYASGVAAARTEMGAGYQAGLNLASAMTFSYLAVEHMATA